MHFVLLEQREGNIRLLRCEWHADSRPSALGTAVYLGREKAALFCGAVPPIDIISTEINFIGNLVGTYNDLAELMTLTAQGKVTYPLDAANDAIHDLDSGKLRGRGILIP